MEGEVLAKFNELLEAGLLSLANVFLGVFKTLGWLLIKLFSWIVNQIGGAITKIYDLNTFFNSEVVENFISPYKNVVWIILAISIAIIGLKIILNRKSDRQELPMNILISILVVTCLTSFMVKLNDVSKLSINDVGSFNTAQNTIKPYFTDIYAIDKDGYQNIHYGINNLTDDFNLNSIDINETIDNDNLTDETYKTMFEYKSSKDKDGKPKKLGKGFLGIGEEEYYRYVVDWIPLIFALAIQAIAFIAVAVKLAKLVFELGFNNLFATLLAFADIDDGRKLKEVIKYILGIFISLWGMGVMLKFYTLFQEWMNTSVGNNDILKLVFLLGSSLALMDGPVLIQKVLGVNAGLKGSLAAAGGAVMATKHAVMSTGRTFKTGLNAGKTVLNAGTKVAQGGINVGAAAAGFSSGFANKNKSNTPNNNSTNGDKAKNSNGSSVGFGVNSAINSDSNSGFGINPAIDNKDNSGSGINSAIDNEGNLDFGINPAIDNEGNLGSGINPAIDNNGNSGFGINSTIDSNNNSNSINQISNQGNRHKDMTLGGALKNKVLNSDMATNVKTTAKRRYDLGYNSGQHTREIGGKIIKKTGKIFTRKDGK